MLGRELIAYGRLTGVNLIIPDPADKKRLRQKTYNQCDLIAEGIADITSLPVASDVPAEPVTNIIVTLIDLVS